MGSYSHELYSWKVTVLLLVRGMDHRVHKMHLACEGPNIGFNTERRAHIDVFCGFNTERRAHIDVFFVDFFNTERRAHINVFFR